MSEMENALALDVRDFGETAIFTNNTNHLQERDQNLVIVEPYVVIKKDAALNKNVITPEIKDKLDILIESAVTINVLYPIEYYPDLLQLHQFLNVHLDFLGLRATFPNGIFMEYLESAIIKRDNVKLYQLLFIFLFTIFKYHSVECERFEFTKSRYDMQAERFYSCKVHELPCDEFTISEVLRLHLLKSSKQSLLKNGNYEYEDIQFYSARQQLAQEFIKKHGIIIQTLHHETIYGLSSSDLLKIFSLLLNQILTYETIRTKIEICSNSLPNYLGCDHFDRKYWRFDFLRGIYIECSDTWKCIDRIANVNMLLEAVNETVLKQNLIKCKEAIVENIRSKKRQHMVNNYNIKNFKSFVKWQKLWQQAFTNYQDLIKLFKLGCKNSKFDFQLFQNDFLQWIIPENKDNFISKSINLSLKQNLGIERKLCFKINIPEIEFEENFLNKIKKLATNLAYTYYMLDPKIKKEKNPLIKKHKMTKRVAKFESFLRIESVAELFLCLYKLYEDLLEYHGKCHICLSDRTKLLSIEICVKCKRPIHANCLKSVPIVITLNSNNCAICQFGLV